MHQSTDRNLPLEKIREIIDKIRNGPLQNYCGGPFFAGKGFGESSSGLVNSKLNVILTLTLTLNTVKPVNTLWQNLN